MAIQTVLTEKLGISAPVLLAPMGMVRGGKLAAAVAEQQKASYAAARDAGDVRVAAVIAGEAVDLVHAQQPAADILNAMVAQAEDPLLRGPALLTSGR